MDSPIFDKRMRDRLNTYTGGETISCGVSWVGAPMEWDKDEANVNVRPDDFVIEFPGKFGSELTLSEHVLDLPPRPDRVGAASKCWADARPVVTFEAWPMQGNVLQVGRFPRRYEWVAGTNWWPDGIDQIPDASQCRRYSPPMRARSSRRA